MKRELILCCYVSWPHKDTSSCAHFTLRPASLRAPFSGTRGPLKFTTNSSFCHNSTQEMTIHSRRGNGRKTEHPSQSCVFTSRRGSLQNPAYKTHTCLQRRLEVIARWGGGRLKCWLLSGYQLVNVPRFHFEYRARLYRVGRVEGGLHPPDSDIVWSPTSLTPFLSLSR